MLHQHDLTTMKRLVLDKNI